jgi:hypothetical protein
MEMGETIDESVGFLSPCRFPLKSMRNLPARNMDFWRDKIGIAPRSANRTIVTRVAHAQSSSIYSLMLVMGQ